jgi:hypothetical protein
MTKYLIINDCSITNHIRFLLCCYLTLAITVTLSAKSIIEQQHKKCGMNPSVHITYGSGARSAEYPETPNPTVVLESVLPFSDQSTILIRAERRGQIAPRQYISQDKGMFWKPSDWELGFTNLPQWSTPNYLMSHVDHQVLYDCYHRCKEGYKRSTDGGSTWMLINPVVEVNHKIREIELIETGMNLSSRVYARIWSDEYIDYRCAVSTDYGQSFDILSEEIRSITESRANPLVFYGIVRSIPGLAISRDGGLHWKSMDGSKEFWKPLYHSKRYISSWKRSPKDLECIPINVIDQVESDPQNADWIYVLTYRGLYFSRDAGNTFRIASIARGRLDSIDKISVDPSDGRYLYAVVDLGKIYRSSDYGCSWKELKLPSISQ